MDNIDEIMEEEFATDFGEGDSKEELSATLEDEAMPQLPDGIGLDYEELRLMLSKKHGTMLGRDEPIMMMVTLCNVLLGELQKLHDRHNGAVTKIMAEQSAKYIAGVKTTTDTLSQTLADTSVEAIKSIFDSHAHALTSNKINSRWCAAVIGLSALANIAVMALKVWN